MIGYRATYREYPAGYANNAGQMFGDNAPAATWEYTFTHALLGPALAFVAPPGHYFGPRPGPVLGDDPTDGGEDLLHRWFLLGLRFAHSTSSGTEGMSTGNMVRKL